MPTRDENDLMNAGELVTDPVEDTEIMVPDEEQPPVVKPPGSAIVFVLTDDGYVPSDASLVHQELQRHQPHVEVVTEKGKPRQLVELIHQYGRRVDRIVYDMTGQQHGYYPTSLGGGDLVMTAARRAPVRPQRDAKVEKWLSLMFQDNLDKGLDWLATAHRLRFPSAALYLQGPPGGGKGMLASVLAKPYGAVTAYKDVIGSFNSALRNCPFILLDEKAPTRIEAGSAEFRSLISEIERPLLEKHKPAATLRGAVRLVIAANNADALRIRETLTPEDETAIGERILHFMVPAEAEEYLNSIGGRGSPDGTMYWVEEEDGSPGRAVRHLAWLEQTRVVKPGHRFLVAGEAGPWLRNAAVRGGLAQTITIAIAKAATYRDNDRAPFAIIFKEGCAYVSPDLMHRKWRMLTGEHAIPELGAIGASLKVLSPDDKPRRPRQGSDGPRLWRWRVPGDRVTEIANMLGIGDPACIDASFGVKPANDADGGVIHLEKNRNGGAA